MMSEYGLSLEDWPLLIPLVQCAINTRRNARTGYTPLEVYYGINADGRCVINHADCDCGINNYPIVHSKKLKYPKDIENLEDLLRKTAEELDLIARHVYDVQKKIRDESRKYANKRITGADLQYEVGEYVLVSRRDQELFPDKLRLIWNGPYLITEITGKYLYKVLSPVDDEKEVHARRLKFYDGKTYEMSEVELAVYLHDAGSQEIEGFAGLRLKDGEYQLLCKWRGMEVGDNTWQEAAYLYRVVPDMVIDYVERLDDTDVTVRALKKSLLNQDQIHAFTY